MNGSAAFVDNMLSWLKGFANWVLKLFNLAGGGASPLAWLADNWLNLLVLLLIIGVAMDILIWLVRWRPYWIWFGKKRMVIYDNNFFAGEEYAHTGMLDDDRAPRRRSSGSGARRRRSAPPAKRPASAHRADPRRSAPENRRSMPANRRSAPASRPQREEVDSLFHVDNAAGSSHYQEDDVFNVTNLPGGSQR